MSNVLPPKEETKKPEGKKPLFRAPKPGEIQFLLVPQDEIEYQRLLELLSKENIAEDSLPKLRKEIKLEKLGPNHTIFVGLTAPTKIGQLDKQPQAYKLKISPPVSAGDFMHSTEDDDILNKANFVDELNKHARPLAVRVSADGAIKLLWM